MRISVKLSPSIEPIPPDVLSPPTNIIRCELSLAYRSIASRHGPNDDPLPIEPSLWIATSSASNSGDRNMWTYERALNPMPVFSCGCAENDDDVRPTILIFGKEPAENTPRNGRPSGGD
jgi:hypothetical protein